MDKLAGVTTWIKRFLYNSQSLKDNRDIGELSADEITDAEKIVATR